MAWLGGLILRHFDRHQLLRFPQLTLMRACLQQVLRELQAQLARRSKFLEVEQMENGKMYVLTALPLD